MNEDCINAEKIVADLVKIAFAIECLQKDREETLQTTHGRFNLFTTLLDAHDEVRLHTRFLAHLLGDKEPHDFGRQFLDLFLDIVGLPDLKKQSLTRLGKEHYTGDKGNIDIYLEFSESVVVIENKIFAMDQGEQLQRYFEYAQSTRKRVAGIFYLTLDGHEPSENSRGCLKKGVLGALKEQEYGLISYVEHILPWLVRCIEASSDFQNVYQALVQYQMTINQLLGNTLEAEDMSRIKELIRGNSEILKHEKQIISAFKEIRQDQEQDIQKRCKEVLGGDVKSWIWYWDAGTAFKFSSPLWGNDEGTDLTVLMSQNGLFSLIAYDVDGGKIKEILDCGSYAGEWKREKSYYHRKYLEEVSLPEALSALRQVISQLK